MPQAHLAKQKKNMKSPIFAKMGKNDRNIEVTLQVGQVPQPHVTSTSTVNHHI